MGFDPRPDSPGGGTLTHPATAGNYGTSEYLHINEIRDDEASSTIQPDDISSEANMSIDVQISGDDEVEAENPTPAALAHLRTHTDTDRTPCKNLDTQHNSTSEVILIPHSLSVDVLSAGSIRHKTKHKACKSAIRSALSYSCPGCNKTFKNLAGLTSHAKFCKSFNKASENSTLGLLTSSSFKSSYNVQDINFPCSFCGRCFKNKAGHSTHMASCKSRHHETSHSNTNNIVLGDLEDLLDKIPGDRTEWPRNLRRATSQLSSKKLPRGSWAVILAHYNKKFSENLSLGELQHLASHHRASDAFSVKSRAFKSNFASAASIASGKRFLESLDIFNEIYNQLLSIQIPDFQGSKKFQTKLVGQQTWSDIDQIVNRKLSSITNPSLSDIARLLQAAQGTIERILIKKAQSSKASKVSTNLNDKGLKLESIRVQLEAMAVSDPSSVPESAFDADNSDPDIREALEFLAERNINPRDAKSRKRALADCNEMIVANNRKMSNADRRRQYWLTNYKFETNRAAFYRSLDKPSAADISPELIESTKSFWSKMWTSDSSLDTVELSVHGNDINESYNTNRPADANNSFIFPSRDEFTSIVASLDNWKSPGPDGIYNIFIKRIPSLHSTLYTLFRGLASSELVVDKWFYSGITHLIPKNNKPVDGKDFRPITCLPNLYKLFTKMATSVLQLQVEKHSLLTPNQLGAIKATQGAKELAMVNFAINRFKNFGVKVAWLDAQKAYDSVLHPNLIEALSSEGIPKWIQQFVITATGNWSLNLRLNGEFIIRDKPVSRGIVQGDSLSPLLFCLSLDRMSRKLEEMCPKIDIKFSDNQCFSINHLIFMDDIKLFADSESGLNNLLEVATRELGKVGLALNHKKSVLNCDIPSSLLSSLTEPGQSYKYLGFDETSRGEISASTPKAIKAEAIRRLELLCASNLNAVHLFTAINEWVISLVDYITGVIDLPKSWFEDLDLSIRRILTKNNIHATPSCLERLYIKRKEIGRGLCNVNHRAERTLRNLWQYINSSSESVSRMERRALIKTDEITRSSRLSGIFSELEQRYGAIDSNVDLTKKQKSSFMDRINTKSQHRQIFRSISNDRVCTRSSSLWLSKGNISPREEGALALLQDRNLFWVASKDKCHDCGNERRTIEHIATRCKRLLSHEYTRRHNEVVTCIALKLARSLNFSKMKGIKNFKIGSVTESDSAKLWVDTHVKTSIQIKCDKPDLLAIDKANKEGIIVDVRITAPELLDLAESEKIQKYDSLANELQGMYGLVGVKIIPIIISWEGVMSKQVAKNLTYLGLAPSEVAYIQTRILKRTLETISLGERRSIDQPISGRDTKTALDHVFLNLEVRNAVDEIIAKASC